MPASNLPQYINGTPGAGSIIIYDGCRWNYTTLSGSLNCADVQACVTAAYIMSQISNSASITKLGNTFNVNMSWVNNNLFSNRSSPVLTVGSTSHDLTDLLNLVQNLVIGTQGGADMLYNNDQLRFTGIDGMRATVGAVAGGTQVSIGLPTSGRQTDYVLSWNGTSAVRVPGCDPCCSQVQDCMQPIIDGLQNQINTIVTLIGGGGGGAEDFTISASYNDATRIATFTRQLGATYILDLNPLIGGFSDNFLQSANLSGSTLSLVMVSGPDITVDLSSLVAPSIIGRDEGTSVVTGLTSINFIGAGVTATDGGGGLLNVTIPGGGLASDELVKVRASDTVGNYLFDSVGNTTTGILTNDGTIKKRVNNPLADENLQLVVDLTLYNGNTTFVGNHTQNGNTTHNGQVDFNTGPVNFNSVTMNHDGVTENYLGDNIYNLLAGASHTYNLGGTVNNNYLATYEENNLYADGATINNDGTITINNANTYIENITGGTVNYTNIINNYIDTPNQIACEITPVFDFPFTPEPLSQYVQLKLVYNNGVDAPVLQTIRSAVGGSDQTIYFPTASNTGVVLISRSGGDVTVTVVSGTTFSFDVTEGMCWYNGVSEINYNNTLIQNINVLEENFGVTNIYDSNSTFIHNGDTFLENLEVNNLTVNNLLRYDTKSISLAGSNHTAEGGDYLSVDTGGSFAVVLPDPTLSEDSLISVTKGYVGGSNVRIIALGGSLILAAVNDVEMQIGNKGTSLDFLSDGTNRRIK